MNILIIRNNSNAAALDASMLLAAYLDSQGVAHQELDSIPLSIESVKDTCSHVDVSSFDMVVSLGGDGTMLRTARLVGKTRVPILGINFGHLGFLVNSSEDGVVAIVAAALAGDVVREERASLHIDLIAHGEVVASRFALNEFSVTRGTLGRIIDFGVDISGNHLVDMRGDGLVVASATGSTAYALSRSEGPLVAPDFKGLVVVPVGSPYVAVPLYRDRPERYRGNRFVPQSGKPRGELFRRWRVHHARRAHRSHPGSQVQ